MRQHTVIGARILSAAPDLLPVAEIVRSSHERWDGGGYPDGLAGEDIPLGARIVAVCDTYEAMTTTRAYRAAGTAQEALAELRRCSGTQFDPRVVGAFLAALAERRRPAPVAA
jgi:HD-GYP domain-containing protein (c-di-GMP phosphodiesterase class II)